MIGPKRNKNPLQLIQHPPFNIQNCYKESSRLVFLVRGFIIPGTLVLSDKRTAAIRPPAKDALSGIHLSLADFGAAWATSKPSIKFSLIPTIQHSTFHIQH